MNWKKIVFGGAGPKMNAHRRHTIDEVNWKLEQWRDFDNESYLQEAIDILQMEKK